MDDTLDSEILQIGEIAAEVREEFEQGTVNLSILTSLYSKHTFVENMNLFLSRARVMFPMGNCGLTSVYLQSVLGGDVRRGWYKTLPHTFLLLDERLVVDITSDQFGGPKVYVGYFGCPYSIAKEKIGTS